MKISVLMSVRNGAQFMPNSIKDIEANVFDDDEILVINDGSSDDTEQMLENWAKNNSQVRVITTEALGFASALNLGLKEATNDWIARFDVDDRYPQNRLSIQRALISDEVSAIFCDYEFWSEKKESLGIIPGAITADATAVSLISSQRTPHPGVIFNKVAVTEAGAYREVDLTAEDISLWLRLAHNGRLITTPQVLVNYRLSKNSISGRNRNTSIRKTRELINEVGISQKSIISCLSNWRKIFAEYDRVTLGSERKVLFYRDLRKSLKLQSIRISDSQEINSIMRTLLLESDSYSAVNKLYKEKTQRNKFRKS